MTTSSTTTGVAACRARAVLTGTCQSGLSAGGGGGDRTLPERLAVGGVERDHALHVEADELPPAGDGREDGAGVGGVVVGGPPDDPAVGLVEADVTRALLAADAADEVVAVDGRGVVPVAGRALGLPL